jgi:hypothetical protein
MSSWRRSRDIALAATALAVGCSGNSKIEPGPSQPGDHVAELGESTAMLAPDGAVSTELIVVPPSGGTAVTTFQTDLAVVASSFTGDVVNRTEATLRFQPVADRALATNSIVLSVQLISAPGGFLAKHYLYGCADASCSTAAYFGKMTAGNWTSTGVIVSQGTTYTAAIAWDASTKIVTFNLSSSGDVLGTATFDLLGSTPTTPALAPPFDLSAESFVRAYLRATVDGGSMGGGSGSITSHFDNVNVGMDGATPQLFDDFDADAVFDAAKWIIVGTGAKVVSR